MEQIEARARKWGDSIAVIIPKKIVQTERIMPNDKLVFSVEKHADLNDVFGSLRDWKINSQKTKEELRKEWKD